MHPILPFSVGLSNLTRTLGLCVFMLLGAATPAATAQNDPAAVFRPLLAGPNRSAANVVRDVYRHPAETLAFFEV
jgi:predicted methyltransferase